MTLEFRLGSRDGQLVQGGSAEITSVELPDAYSTLTGNLVYFNQLGYTINSITPPAGYAYVAGESGMQCGTHVYRSDNDNPQCSYYGALPYRYTVSILPDFYTNPVGWYLCDVDHIYRGTVSQYHITRIIFVCRELLTGEIICDSASNLILCNDSSKEILCQ